MVCGTIWMRQIFARMTQTKHKCAVYASCVFCAKGWGGGRLSLDLRECGATHQSTYAHGLPLTSYYLMMISPTAGTPSAGCPTAVEKSPYRSKIYTYSIDLSLRYVCVSHQRVAPVKSVFTHFHTTQTLKLCASTMD